SRRRKPIVMSFMGDDLLGSPYNETGDLEWFSRVMVRANKRLATRVARGIVKSKGMADVIAPTPSAIIAIGIDIDIFRPISRAAACDQLGFDQNILRVLFPGNPDNPNKGFAFAKQVVDVAARQLDRHIELTPLWNIEP